jgi:hypothetical protein
VREIGDDRLAAVARIVPDQIVEHWGHRAQCPECPGLVNIEMGRAHQKSDAQHAAGFGIGLRSCELKFRAVELVRDFGGMAEARRQTIDSSGYGGGTLQKTATGPPRAFELRVVHNASLPLGLFRTEHGVL